MGPRTGVENIASTEIRSLDRSPRSESLYRLSSRGPRTRTIIIINVVFIKVPSLRPITETTHHKNANKKDNKEGTHETQTYKTKDIKLK